ncbi:hypothetical protein BZA05DRAFT_387925 [Tricharina praecox]|uniref:uncharacterized protein n=1 Tax=Tricharina praecox TaxID=43433 RepID=UPI0022207B7E|nr:uncharacterized protein BZA05DRAFT_387925 [Tricharina praecox]KAI5856258.1 hypothetical protein BZA05DRAFT_387925 [Tricharina praecox]
MYALPVCTLLYSTLLCSIAYTLLHFRETIPDFHSTAILVEYRPTPSPQRPSTMDRQTGRHPVSVIPAVGPATHVCM